MAPYNLPGIAVPLLLRILAKPGSNQDDLCRHGFADKTLVSRALRRMEREGYVTRAADETDNRAKCVFPTERAHALEPTIQGWLREWNDLLAAGLTAEQTEAAMELLQHLAVNARGRVCDPADSPQPCSLRDGG
jgi:DNA-binding MarR family transcriptional regulator